ncbi:MAG: hypothetical protein Q8K72_01235, partial [Acidimicrobiales bacterium]|nr:hypothetical protein [Acidimicrobiales bacterium]
MADKPKGRLTLGSEPRRRPDLARFAPTMHTLTGSLPVWLLVVVHVVAGPLLLFHYGSYHWFRLDDSAFLVDGSSFPDLFEPHGGTHWTAVPEVVFWGLWKAVGATSYRYYQIPVLVTHLALGVLLNAVMGRSRVRPWLRFAAVTLFVLVGPGAVN